MWQGDVRSRGHAGACVAGGMVGGVHGRGHAWQGQVGGVHGGGVRGRGAWMVRQGGMHATHAPSPTLRDMVGQCAGDTHPTGMHSCYFKNINFFCFLNICSKLSAASL